MNNPLERAMLPFVLLHEMLHALGLEHFADSYEGSRQVMHDCGVMFSGKDDPVFQAMMRETLGDTAVAKVAALGPEAWGKFCDEVLLEIVKSTYSAVLGQGDINGLRYLTRGDLIDPATGAFTPGKTPEAIDAAPVDTGRWNPCDRCVIL